MGGGGGSAVSLVHSYPAPLNVRAVCSPYDKIVGELLEIRRETVDLARQAVSEGRHAYVLVNNRSEGNARLTVQALLEQLS